MTVEGSVQLVGQARGRAARARRVERAGGRKLARPELGQLSVAYVFELDVGGRVEMNLGGCLAVAGHAGACIIGARIERESWRAVSRRPKCARCWEAFDNFDDKPIERADFIWPPGSLGVEGGGLSAPAKFKSPGKDEQQHRG